LIEVQDLFLFSDLHGSDPDSGRKITGRKINPKLSGRFVFNIPANNIPALPQRQ
jgi:hypothetical protein